jgi:hypothetical protein
LLAVALARGVVERLPVSRADAFAFGPALIVRPALIARPSQPRVELVLDRALDDQPRSEPGQPDNDSRGFSPTTTASNRSICASISADGGTVRLTA